MPRRRAARPAARAHAGVRCATPTRTCRSTASASMRPGVTPDDLETLEDIAKFPFVVKQDMRDAYPFGMFARRRTPTWPASTPPRALRARPPWWGIPPTTSRTGATASPAASPWWAATRIPPSRCPTATACSRAVWGRMPAARPWAAPSSPPRRATPSARCRCSRTARPISWPAPPPTPCSSPTRPSRWATTRPPSSKSPAASSAPSPASENMRQEIADKLGIQYCDVVRPLRDHGPGRGHGVRRARRSARGRGPVLLRDHRSRDARGPPRRRSGRARHHHAHPRVLAADPLPHPRRHHASTPSRARAGAPIARSGVFVGRTDDMLIIRGVNVFPSQIEQVITEFPEIATQYQIILTMNGPLDHVELQVETEPDFPIDEVRQPGGPAQPVWPPSPQEQLAGGRRHQVRGAQDHRALRGQGQARHRPERGEPVMISQLTVFLANEKGRLAAGLPHVGRRRHQHARPVHRRHRRLRRRRASSATRPPRAVEVLGAGGLPRLAHAGHRRVACAAMLPASFGAIFSEFCQGASHEHRVRLLLLHRRRQGC